MIYETKREETQGRQTSESSFTIDYDSVLVK